LLSNNQKEIKMARNQEKALTLFNKWHTFKQDFHAVSGNRRPLFSSQVQSLPDCEKHRRSILSSLSKNIAAIKNAELGEHKIREMNDEINKLMKQKYYWEIRIRELGGNLPAGKQFYDIEGKDLPGAPGYRYYGAAMDLPGIRELFAEAETRDDEITKDRSRKRKIQKDLYQRLTPQYFGYGLSEDDPDYQQMVKAEIQAEREFLREYQRNHFQEILNYRETEEELQEWKDLEKISEEVMEYVKTMGQHSDSSNKQKNPFQSDFRALNQINNAIPETEETKKEVSQQQEVETGAGGQEEDVQVSKKALLDKLNFLL
jgi:hypothetical protein